MTGESVCLYLPNLNADCFEAFLRTLSEEYPSDFIVLVIDNAPAHIRLDLIIPDNITLLNLPPYSPELNPVERWFRELRYELANTLFDTIDDIHLALTDFLKQFWNDPERLQLLSNFPWWSFAVTSIPVLRH